MAKRTKAQEKKDRDLLIRIRKRAKIMMEADQDNRREAMEDFKFVNVPGYQWDDNMRKERGNRPCYEFNKLRVNGKRVINEIRANRPQGKVRPTEGGDKKQAELREGLCRNIWATSKGDSVVDYEAEYIVDAGMGVWRIDTEYSTDDTFDQDIVVRAVKNPFCVYADPACKDPMKRDAEDWIVTERISKSSFEMKYPDAAPVDFEENEFDDDEDWEDEEQVRICEYWYKEPFEKEVWLVQFPDGQQITVDSETDEAEALKAQPGFEQMIVKRRMVKSHKIMSCIVSGSAVLEPPEVRAGSQHRFVMVYGEYKVIDGKVCWHGLHRFSKDAQQSYNVSRTAIDETIATAPKQGFWATPTQAEGLTDQWADAHKKNLPFRLYNPDPKAPGAPSDYRGADVPVALLQQATIASQDIRDTSGLHEASFGEESSEKSGIALARKQNQASIVTFNFPDNIGNGIQRTWEIMLDLIPEIYDAEREIRILGQDGVEDYQTINKIVRDPSTGKEIRVNDMSFGKYDVTITVGPSYSTMRQEAAEVYGELGAKNPALMQVAGDLVFKSLDYPYADEIAERWQTILPPPIQKLLAEGKDIPPEAQAAMAQAEQAMQLVQQQAVELQQAAQELENEKSASEKQKAEVREAMAKLETQQAKFEAAVAKKLAELTTRQAQLSATEAQLGTREGELKNREDIANGKLTGLDEVTRKIDEIDELIAQYIQGASQVMASIDQKTMRPKLKGAKVRRDKGELMMDAEYDDGSVRTIRGQRVNGELVAVPVESGSESAS